MDWGSFVIVAVLIWPDGHSDVYKPTTLFDETACFRQAKQINVEWERSQITGFATCRRAGEDEVNAYQLSGRHPDSTGR